MYRTFQQGMYRIFNKACTEHSHKACTEHSHKACTEHLNNAVLTLVEWTMNQLDFLSRESGKMFGNEKMLFVWQRLAQACVMLFLLNQWPNGPDFLWRKFTLHSWSENQFSKFAFEFVHKVYERKICRNGFSNLF
jgi:hypothetical protein